jgi:tetratricopeptide (TPR) repeat protein
MNTYAGVMDTSLENVENLLDGAIRHLNLGQYKEAIAEAEKLLGLEVPRHTIGSCYWIAGCARRELGDVVDGLGDLIEATAILAEENQVQLLAHAQDELARTLFQLTRFNAALFFINMAISNFEAVKNQAMIESSQNFREKILWKL